jgi:nuclease S1
MFSLKFYGRTLRRSDRLSNSLAGRLWGVLIHAWVGVCCGLFSQAAWAWGAQGHRLVAELAEPLLTPAASAEVARLLALEPGATLTSISTWADEVRSPSTTRWHYVNFQGAHCSYEPERDCPQGHCAVAAIDRHLQQLARTDGRTDPLERLKALKWVVHLVGDVHQPLHAGWAEDRGGNDYQLQAFGRGTNLHALWDSGLIHEVGQASVREAAAARVRQLAQGSHKGQTVASGQAQDWALESCQVVASTGFYPSARHLPASYPAQWGPVLTERLARAAWRLSQVLNEALDGSQHAGHAAGASR